MKIRIIIFFILSTIIISCTSHKENSKENLIPFRWESFDLNGKHYKYGAMLIPVEIEGIDKQFEMQFDLGANSVIIYENPLKTILNKYPSLKKNYIKDDDDPVFCTNLNLNHYSSSIDSLRVYKNYGSSDNFQNLKHIGTVGQAEIKNKILIIDYPNQTLEILNNKEQIIEKDFNYTPIEVLSYGKLKFNLTINNEEYPFLFDTGSGIVPATTIDKILYDKITIADTSLQDTITGNSWGNPVTLWGNTINNSIKIGANNINANDNRFYFTNDKRIVDGIRQMGLYGAVGNTFFINDVIVIDLINNRFGIKKKKRTANTQS